MLHNYVLSLILISSLWGNLAFAHQKEYSASPPDSKIQAEASPAEVTDQDRQIAFFEYEMLMHLALNAPSPHQKAFIDQGFADHQLVTKMPGRPKLEELKHLREHLADQLKEDFAICQIDWFAEKVERRSHEPIDVSLGLPRTLLLEITNRSDRYIDLHARQSGNQKAPPTNYTIHAGKTVFVPVDLLVGDQGQSSVTIELDKSGKAVDKRKVEIPIKPSQPAILKGTLIDADLSQAFPGRVFVLGNDRIYRHGIAFADNETLSTKQLLQFWNLGRYYKLPFFYSDGTFEVVVPAGKTKVKLERGFEHEVVETNLDLIPGETREIHLASGRLVDMKSQGWISGDTHIHWVTNQWNVDLPLELLATVQRAEDLQVANNLTLLQRGPSLAFINPAQAPMGPVEHYSDDKYHIEMGEEYRNEDLYGHLCFLNLDWLVQPIGTGSVIAGPDALDYPINKTAILACREQGGISCEAHGLGGNKDVPVNVVHQLTDSLDQIHPHEYYDFLDCGFHLPLTNGSDHPARVAGCARAYVKVDGEFTYDKWIDGIRKCRTFTTSGPLVSLQVNDADIGDTLSVTADHQLKIHAEVTSRYPVGNFQIVSNGEVIKQAFVEGNHAVLQLSIPASESRWIVARCSPTDNYNAIKTTGVAHTSAIYINVDGRPRFVAATAKRWISEMQKHIRDIRMKGHFANDRQMQEAIDYVQAGITKYEELIDKNKPSLQLVSTQNKKRVDQSSQTTWPMVEKVEAQPLLAQVHRLTEALDYIGNPLSKQIKAELMQLHDEKDEKRIALKVQELLDPLCLAAADIDNGKLTASAQSGNHEILESGWRSYLVKVCNHSGLTTRLSVESPNARSMPHAKQEDVASRWLGLSMFDGRPMQTNLSGLELEYRIIQLYSRDSSRKNATIEFSIDAEPGKLGRQIREWRFDKDADGWEALNQTEIEVRDGSLHVTGTGLDPFIGAEVGGATGDVVLRFWAETEDDGVGQIFWWTEERPEPNAERCATIPLIPGGPQQYEVPLTVEGVLAGVRIDPNVKPCKMRFDWIDLSYAHRRGETWDSVPLNFEAKPAIPITLNIKDKPGEPSAAAFVIRDHLGRVYPEQSKRLAPDFFFHPQIYRLDGEVILLPPGKYTVRCWRGPHSIPEEKKFVVGNEPTTFDYQVRRWVDPTTFGWWSGDHHIHAAGCLHYQNPTQGVLPKDMLRQTMGEDMNVGCCLTWGPCFDYQKQFFTGSIDKSSKYPYLIRYDVEVSGFGSHASGHLNLLRLKEQIYPGGDSKDHWPTLGLNTLRWAKQQGAICGPAHSANGLTNYVGRLEGHEDGPNGLPHFNIPAFDGIGANEYIVDVTHKVQGPDQSLIPAIDFISTMNTPRQDEWNMWYHSLNCGFHVRASGETDFPCMSGERVGIGRVYVKVDDRLNFDDWIQGIQDGRSYISDGKAHIIDFEARTKGDDNYLAVGEGRSEIAASGTTTIVCRAKCAALVDRDLFDTDIEDKLTVELIANGYPVATTEITADGSLQEVHLEAEVERSSWLALRIFPHAHSNPFFVIVDEQPIRASKASAEWCLRCVEQCWREKQQTYALEEQEDARQAYDHARAVYQSIIAGFEE